MKHLTEGAQGAPTKARSPLGAAIAGIAVGVLIGGMSVGSAPSASAAPAASPGVAAPQFNCGHRIESPEGAWVRENPDTNSVKLKWKPWHSYVEWHCDWNAVRDGESGVWFQPVICACASDDVGWIPSSAFD